MLTLPPSMRVCVAAEPADLRKRFDGLSVPSGSVTRPPPEDMLTMTSRISSSSRSGLRIAATTFHPFA
ncbi:hypothetical protein WMF00_37020 [Sorangium sp. So ce1182]